MKSNIAIVGIIALLIGGISGYVLAGGNHAPENNKPQKMNMMDHDIQMDQMSMAEMMEAMNTELTDKNGDAFDKAFIDEMIVHHQGAIAMAKLALENSDRKEILELARAIIEAQKGEIAQMKNWRQVWFARK